MSECVANRIHIEQLHRHYAAYANVGRLRTLPVFVRTRHALRQPSDGTVSRRQFPDHLVQHVIVEAERSRQSPINRLKSTERLITLARRPTAKCAKATTSN